MMVTASHRQLVIACRYELESLWGDLCDSQRNAQNGVWSIACDDVEDRIKALTVLVGHTNWQKIPLTLLMNGVYQRIHRDLGIRVRPDMAQVREIDEQQRNYR